MSSNTEKLKRKLMALEVSKNKLCLLRDKMQDQVSEIEDILTSMDDAIEAFEDGKSRFEEGIVELSKYI